MLNSQWPKEPTNLSLLKTWTSKKKKKKRRLYPLHRTHFRFMHTQSNILTLDLCPESTAE